MAPSPRPPPPGWITLVPPAAAALVFALQPPIWVAWAVLGGALLVAGIIEVVAVATRAGRNRRPELQPMSEAGVWLARMVGVAVTAMQSMMAVAIGLGKLEAIPRLVAAGLLAILLATVLGVRRISAALEAVRAAGHGELVRGYGPLIYRNKDDPRIWVPKLGGVGMTLNFAHPVSWWILAAFLVLPIGGAAVAILSAIARMR